MPVTFVNGKYMQGLTWLAQFCPLRLLYFLDNIFNICSKTYMQRLSSLDFCPTLGLTESPFFNICKYSNSSSASNNEVLCLN